MTNPAARPRTVVVSAGESPSEGQSRLRDVADRHCRVLVGSGILLLTTSLLNGFVIGIVPMQRLAVSAHVSGLIGSSFLIALGAIWPRLHQSSRTSMAGAVMAVHGFFGGWLVLFLAAASSIGGPAAPATGHAWVRQALRLGNLTVIVALFGLCAIVLRGIRSRVG